MQHTDRIRQLIALTLVMAACVLPTSIGHTEPASILTSLVKNIRISATQLAVEMDQETGCKLQFKPMVQFKPEDAAARVWFSLFLMAKELKHPVYIQYDKGTCSVVYVKLL